MTKKEFETKIRALKREIRDIRKILGLSEGDLMLALNRQKVGKDSELWDARGSGRRVAPQPGPHTNHGRMKTLQEMMRQT